MNKLLHSLIALTSQREREQIDASLATALQERTCAISCAFYGVTCLQGESWLTLQALVAGGVTTMTTHEHPATAQPSSEFPVLAACLESHAKQTFETLPDNCTATWIPLWNDNSGRVEACVRLVTQAQPPPDMLDDVQGLIATYQNFTHLLEDNERDSLTGLLNRKTFDSRFSELVGTAFSGAQPPLAREQSERRTGDAVTAHWLGVIDIDHFKMVNDQFGHVYGDEVLILLANILKASFRDQDRVYRFGGEEFVVLLRATTADDAIKSFERLRARVEAHEFPQIKQVTISLGFASITQETPVSILGHADQALYYAKEHGRNRVCFYDELAASGQIGSLVVHQDADFF